MAITINQNPTSPNLSNGNLVFAVNSTQIAQPQFQYVCDVLYSPGGALIQRIKQQPNPTGYGVFDLSMIITSTLGPTDKVWTITAAEGNSERGSLDSYEVKFGEEYGTSVSSSVILYNGRGGAGSPSVSGSVRYNMLDGTLNPNDKVNWNWASGSKLDEHNINDDTFNFQYGLTDFPATQSIRSTDYHTLSLLNGNLQPIDSPTVAQDVYVMEVVEYNSAGAALASASYYNNETDGNGGPRNNAAQVWADVYASQNADTRLIHFPAGPQNFAGAGNTLNANTAYYVCTFYEQATDGFRNDNGIWGTYRFNLTTRNCGYDGVRFAWKNKYGVWDYYTMGLAETSNSSIERKNYKQTFVNFSSTSASVPYDKTRRGENNYMNKIVRNKTAESDWLTQTYADLLTELFYSTNVYIQDGTQMLPVVIKNASIEEKTNPRTQKLFKYTVEYALANDIQARL